ncbi:MAG: GNAT family N-acetyltransferase [Terracidiphilus sp.]
MPLTSAGFRIESLGPRHERAAFRCGLPALDQYLERQASQDLKRRLAAVFVLTQDGTTVTGFYTLSAHSILAADLPAEQARKLPRFPLPVTLLGRMAVDLSVQGRRLGEFLLLDALHRSLLGSRQVASYAVIVDSKPEARAFYLKHDFLPLVTRPERLFLPMRTIEQLFP